MHTSIRLISMIAFTVLLVSPQTSRAVLPGDDPQPIPPGFDWKLPSSFVYGLISMENTQRIRQHAWVLFMGVNQPHPAGDGYPIWRSWGTSGQLFAREGGHLGLGTGPSSSDPNVSQIRTLEAEPACSSNTTMKLVGAEYEGGDVADGAAFQNNGDIMIAVEAFNLEAYDHIRQGNLYQNAELVALKSQGDLEVPSLPDRAVVLKAMYWPVRQTGFSALPVWDDPPPVQPAEYAGFERMSYWPRAVAIDPNRTTAEITPGETQDVTLLAPGQVSIHCPPEDSPTPLGPNTYFGAEVVSKDRFYYKQLDAAALAELAADPNSLAIINNSFRWAYGQDVAEGDYLLLVAMHIQTREIPEWTYQTIWWHDKPNEGPWAADRPLVSPLFGPWEQYLMAHEYEIAGGTVEQIFNPYIELSADHPIRTNCRACHQRASALPSVGMGEQATALVNFLPDNPIFLGTLRTDHLWTVAARNILCGSVRQPNCHPADPRRADMSIAEKAGRTKLKFAWQVGAGISVEEFKDPVRDNPASRYALCVYDSSVDPGARFSVELNGGRLVKNEDGSKGWRARSPAGVPASYGFIDTTGGKDFKRKAKLAANPKTGKAKIRIDADDGGVAGELPVDAPVTAQFVAAGLVQETACFEADLSSIRKNDASRFKAKNE